MPLLSLSDLSRELAVSRDVLEELIEQNVIIPFGGRARLGEPRFSPRTIPDIRAKLQRCHVMAES